MKIDVFNRAIQQAPDDKHINIIKDEVVVGRHLGSKVVSWVKGGTDNQEVMDTFKSALNTRYGHAIGARAFESTGLQHRYESEKPLSVGDARRTITSADKLESKQAALTMDLGRALATHSRPQLVALANELATVDHGAVVSFFQTHLTSAKTSQADATFLFNALVTMPRTVGHGGFGGAEFAEVFGGRNFPIQAVLNKLDLNAIDVATAQKLLSTSLPEMKQDSALTVLSLLKSPLLRQLKQLAPTEFATFANATPALRLANSIHDRVTNGTLAPGQPAHDRLFGDFVSNTGINVGYMSGGSTNDVNHIMLKDGLPLPPGYARPSMDCHRLCNTLASIFEIYSNLSNTPITIGKQDIPRAVVLTKPIGTTPHQFTGLITPTNGFNGNVKNSLGVFTGRVAFTDQPNPHTYLLVNGRQFDALFGTVGAEVTNMVDGTFDGTATDDKTTITGTGHSLTRTKDTVTGGPENYGGFSQAYTLT
jgi:hypothetical protein